MAAAETSVPSESVSAGYLTIERIRRSGDLGAIEIEVPQWGGKVRVRPLTVCEMHSARRQAETPRQNPDGTFRTDYDAEELELAVLVEGMVDPKLANADKDWLREEVSYGAISRITRVILEASGMGGGAEKKLAMNSVETPR